MPASEFVRRLHAQSKEPDLHYAFWLGAGCSVSSGIPAAGSLVRDQWLPRLQRLQGGSGDVRTWARDAYPVFDAANPAAFYGTLMDRLFLNVDGRQRETERLCDGREPGFGYAVLAALMSLPSGLFSAALTTNFDDLIADAMYVFGDRRPLVIQHESLAGFVRPGRVQRPLVVKIHGDHRLNPMHTPTETAELDEPVAEGVRGILQDRGVIFAGYSGNDQGVVRTLRSLPGNALPLGVWWVARREPTGLIRDWLERRDAIWVESTGFDELMLLFREQFEIPHPEKLKFDRMVEGYRATYQRLRVEVDELTEAAVDSGPLKEAVRRADEDATDWWGVDLAARRYIKSDPERADAIYAEGVRRIEDARLLGNYAWFASERGDVDKAQGLYQRAIAANPGNANNLSNYADLLTDVLGQHDRAQELYERAIAADPENANALGNYALLLMDALDQHDRAQELFEQAIAADPGHANNLCNYADLLTDVLGQHDRAQELYGRAIAADPQHVNALNNYALFLQTVREEYDRAQEMFEQAIAADSGDGNSLGNFAYFTGMVRGDSERALALYERAVAAEPADADILSSFAIFIGRVSGDPDRAQELFERAIAADPRHAVALRNYGSFMMIERDEPGRALELYTRAIAADPVDANALGNCARLLFQQGDDAGAADLVERAFANARPEDAPLRAELWLYLLALGSPERWDQALGELVGLVGAGARSPGWDFSRILARARSEGRNEIEWLERLAHVIGEKADASELDEWEAWRSAGER